MIRHATIITALTMLLGLAGCATETSNTVTPAKVNAANTSYTGQKSSLAIGKFDNRSTFMTGMFSSGTDRLGSQSRTILITHLQQSNRFSVMDRDNLNEIKEEARLSGRAQQLKGAAYVITGDVTEFGRKETGDQQLFGILGRGKTQIAYSKVSLNVIDPVTSEVIFSVQGAGEYALSNREVIGFGGTTGYDSTLNGKVLDLAIREAVNRLVDGIEQGAWKPNKAGSN